jgi:hypothetical protein
MFSSIMKLRDNNTRRCIYLHNFSQTSQEANLAMENGNIIYSNWSQKIFVFLIAVLHSSVDEYHCF